MHSSQMQQRFPSQDPPNISHFSRRGTASESSSSPRNGSYGGPREHKISRRARFEASAEAPGSAEQAATQQMQVPVVYFCYSSHMLYFSPAFGFGSIQGSQQFVATPGVHSSMMPPSFRSHAPPIPASFSQRSALQTLSYPTEVSMRPRFETATWSPGSAGPALGGWEPDFPHHFPQEPSPSYQIPALPYDPRFRGHQSHPLPSPPVPTTAHSEHPNHISGASGTDQHDFYVACYSRYNR